MTYSFPNELEEQMTVWMMALLLTRICYIIFTSKHRLEDIEERCIKIVNLSQLSWRVPLI